MGGGGRKGLEVRGRYGISVVDPDHFDADPHSTCHPDADADSDFFYADPDPTFDCDAAYRVRCVELCF